MFSVIADSGGTTRAGRLPGDKYSLVAVGACTNVRDDSASAQPESPFALQGPRVA